MDIVGIALSQAAMRSVWAVPGAFVAGAATCFGPCAAPRFVAVTGFVAERRGSKRWHRVMAFVAGLCSCYIAIGTVSAFIMRLALWSPWIYAALATLLGVMGLRSVLSSETKACSHNDAEPPAASLGVVFLIGCSFGLVVSPCCTPVVATLAALTGSAGDPVFSGVVLGAFALGHAAPLLAATFAAGNIRLIIRHAFEVPIAVVSGALMIALAGYYALLA
jgi:cytochrome c-type biogenesis protein